MNYRNHLIPVAVLTMAACITSFAAEEVPSLPSLPTRTVPRAATPSPSTKQAPKKESRIYDFDWVDVDLDIVLSEYSKLTHRSMIKDKDLKATFTFSPYTKLTETEYLDAMDALLGMQQISLIPMGDKFYKVVRSTAADLNGHGIQVKLPNEEISQENSEQLVTKIIQLNNVEIPEVQNAIQHLMHAYGKIMALQRSNSLMITDTAENLKRVEDLIQFLDVDTVSIEPKIYRINHAKATDIASKLNEIVQAAQGDKKQTTATTTRSTSTARTPAGVIRASANRSASRAPTQASISQTEAGSSAIIHGEVKIIADERTQNLIIFSQKENFPFFEHIIEQLDIQVDATLDFKVVNLQYADAEEISGTLNDLIGAAQGNSSSSGSSSSSNHGGSAGAASRSGSVAGSRSSGSSKVTPRSSAVGSLSSLDMISEDTKILAEKRTNSLILMGPSEDINFLKNIIAELDVMLEQVIIECAIFEIGLTDALQHGIQWLYKNQRGDKMGSWDGAGLVTNALTTVASSSLTYGQILHGVDTTMAINMAKTDSDARLLATPVITTTDNTEASLSIGERRPIVTSTSSYANSSGTQSSQYEYKDIGIQLTVTPRINPDRVVIMELKSQADQLGGTVAIDDNEVPIILNRDFEATVSVPDRGTIALGGLITTESTDSLTKIPLLGDIPFIGRYLFSSVSKNEIQRELMVLMTPYVQSTQEAMTEETKRLYKATDIGSQGSWPGRTWSDSKLQGIPSNSLEEKRRKAAAHDSDAQDEKGDAFYYDYE